jgi:hypothetical protein
MLYSRTMTTIINIFGHSAAGKLAIAHAMLAEMK